MFNPVAPESTVRGVVVLKSPKAIVVLSPSAVIVMVPSKLFSTVVN